MLSEVGREIEELISIILLTIKMLRSIRKNSRVRMVILLLLGVVTSALGKHTNPKVALPFENLPNDQHIL
jgi:hypothetical protein